MFDPTGGYAIFNFHSIRDGSRLGAPGRDVLPELIAATYLTIDRLFRGTVGGTRAPGHTSFEDIQHSIMEVLMRLPKEMVVHPGHTDPTTIHEEWESNPFIRLWRGADQVNEQRCTAFGQPAALLLQAQDYDGGTKCWVRFEEEDKLDIVPGSQVHVAG